MTSNSNDLAAQIRRSAVLIASTIAEGAACTRTIEFRQMLAAARGSLTELEMQVMIATDLRIVSGNIPLETDIGELRLLLIALIRRLSESRERL